MTCKHIFSSDEGTSHCTLAGVTAEQWQAMKTELSQLRAEREGLNEEALENAGILALHLFDQQGWDLGDLSAEEITKRIIQRYLKLTRTEQKEGV